MIHVQGMQIRYATLGNGPDIVLMHGYPETLQSFYACAPLVAARGFTVHAFDWPGAGKSDIGDMRAGALVGFISSLLSALDLRRVSIAAAGFAVPLALMFTLDHPDRVDRLVVSNGVGPYRPEFQGRVVRLMLRPYIGELFLRLRGAAALKKVFRSGAGALLSLPEAVSLDFTDAALHRARQKALLVLFRSIIPAQVALSWRLARMARPVLVLWGERDALIDGGMATAINAAIPGSELRWLTDVGHFAALEVPELFAQHIAEFCDPQRGN